MRIIAAHALFTHVRIYCAEGLHFSAFHFTYMLCEKYDGSCSEKAHRVPQRNRFMVLVAPFRRALDRFFREEEKEDGEIVDLADSRIYCLRVF